MIVVTSEGLVRVDDRKSRGAGGDCESDSNKYEDFFHGRILSKGQFELYHSHAGRYNVGPHHHNTYNVRHYHQL